MNARDLAALVFRLAVVGAVTVIAAYFAEQITGTNFLRKG